MTNSSSALALRDPSELDDEALAGYADAHGVTWFGFWSVPAPPVDHRRIWRRPYPHERAFMGRYFPPWFAEQRISVRNAIYLGRSYNFFRNNITMAPDKFANQGFHGGLSPIADLPTFGHELLHAMDRQLRGSLEIWASYIIRLLPDPSTGVIDEGSYYAYDGTLTKPEQMLEQFRELNPEAQGELFEEGIRRSEALLAAPDEGRAEAQAQLEAYAAVLDFVRALSREGRLRPR